MNWSVAKDHWKNFKGTVKARWDKLTDDELETVAGEREDLVGCIQERYGMSRDAAEWQLMEFERKLSRVHY
ncbi:CsbD family protein [Thioalkalivibrio sp.]|uniref:CsbD family protein n=1 Tax=Thioalkalivibrio sp. TaxID=2093813 RepID=UPI0035669FE7